ncbi:hypothetical protein QAD02_005996 [Eretmocerus hayati]|uniref:Uncharacterized protein n=1 Tax=Eretmocerus hayati TaxID=131215 RepID=A0ACC2N038_9HYME|nr:hypothetical protein QAD02_005996 [Eretmocerus hayati]
MGDEQDFNRSGLTIRGNKVWYTGQRAQKIPSGLIGVAGIGCTSLDVSYNELMSISSLRDFPYLQELILDNNDLRDLRSLPELPKLLTLSLNNNKIADMESALEKIKQCCPKIHYVSLLGNPGCPDGLSSPNTVDEEDYERYRMYAIYILPETLQFLDSRQISKSEQNQAKSRGRFMKTVRLNIEDKSTFIKPPQKNEFDEAKFYANYTPLPDTERSLQDRKSAYGKCRYRYSGKNSEGNRFILNHDL